VNDNFEPKTIDGAVTRIAEYAREHKLTPGAVCDIFSAGLCAARILAPDLAGKEIDMHNRGANPIARLYAQVGLSAGFAGKAVG
jgi:hypothetical protein